MTLSAEDLDAFKALVKQTLSVALICVTLNALKCPLTLSLIKDDPHRWFDYWMRRFRDGINRME